MDQLQLKDFLRYRFLSSPKFAPGGARAAFVVTSCRAEDNSYASFLWLWEDGRLRQLTGLGKESQFIWEDDMHLLFPAVRSKEEQKRQEAKEEFTSFYRLCVSGGEALPAFTLPFSVSQLHHISGSRYLVEGVIDAANPDYYRMDPEGREKVAKAHQENQDYEVLDEIPFWFNGQGFLCKKRTALFDYDVETGALRRLTAPLFSLDSLAIVGQTAYFLGEEYRTKPTGHDSLWKLEGSELRCLSAQLPVQGGQLLSVGERLLLLGSEGLRHGLNENDFVYTVDTETGALSLLRAEEENMYSSVGSDCRYGGGEPCQVRGEDVFHLTTRWGDSHLYRLSPEPDTGLLVAMYDCKLQELYTYNLTSRQLNQVSHFNDACLAGKYVAEPQPLRLESCGLEIEGWILMPKDFDPAGTYPAILDIHGGPKTVYGPVFYHEMQLWANRGYFVLFCNPMGSDGRGNRFADIRGRYGETDYQNLMDFTDAALARYPQIDPKRLAVTGGSYGGFMTNWIIGHTDRFACAVSQRSISNWLSFYGVSDIGYRFATDQCGGDLFHTPETLWAHSPLRYAQHVKTPTLFIHSDEDYRCPMAEGMQMYTALVDRGIPARLCYFRGENHELSRSGKPKHRIRRLQEITDWIESYTQFPADGKDNT